MDKRRLPKHKIKKPGKRNKSKSKIKTSKQNKKTMYHHQYGNIPLIEKIEYTQDGKPYNYISFDPDYTPPLPKGGIRANIRKQLFCPYCNVPKYYYVDETKKCIQCGIEFIFSVNEQRYWYETLQFYLYSTAVRCKECRKQRRTLKSICKQLEKITLQLDNDPGNPDLLIQYAECTVHYYKMKNEGKLEKAINSCRKAREIYPDLLESLYWEGECLFLLGHIDKALKKYNEFHELTKNKVKYSRLRKATKKILEAG